MIKKSYSGINIQFPISQLILSGNKTVETRTYPIPSKYLNEHLLMIETPGKTGNFKARIVAIIKFTSCFKYKNEKEFYSDTSKHRVDKNSPWAWNEKSKFGWDVEVVKIFPQPIKLTKNKGIKFTQNIKI